MSSFCPVYSRKIKKLAIQLENLLYYARKYDKLMVMKKGGKRTMTEIVFKNKHVAVIYKPCGIPAQPDPSGDSDAMTLTASALCELGEPDSLWLVHRLDRVTSGLMIFARSKKYAAILSDLVREHLFTKEYYAVVDGEPCGGVLEDLLYKDSRSSKAFVVDRERQGVKRARLSYKRLATVSTDKGTRSLLYVSLDTGRFHQIRAQFSHRGTPITGDGKYGSRDNGVKGIALMAARISLELPFGTLDVSRLPETDTYPWSLFAREDYKIGEKL